MFLTARQFMYQQVYFHRTVRAIDLDLAEVFGASIRAIFGDGSPADDLSALRRPRRVRPAPPGRPLGARRGRRPPRWFGPDARGPPGPGHRRGRLAIDPAAAAELALRDGGPGGVRSGRRADRIDRHAGQPGGGPRRDRPGRRRRSTIAGRRGRATARHRDAQRRAGPSLAEALGRLPGYALIGRRYRRGRPGPTS